MIIYFLRHASAGQHLANPKKDEKRGLDKDGIEQCGYVGRALAALAVQVDVVISMPLKPLLWLRMRWVMKESYRSRMHSVQEQAMRIFAECSTSTRKLKPSWS